MFAIKLSMEKRIKKFGVAGFFLPTINTIVFTRYLGSAKLLSIFIKRIPKFYFVPFAKKKFLIGILNPILFI